MRKVKIHECPYCQCKDLLEITEKEIDPFNECKKCHEVFPIYVEFITDKERLEKETLRSKSIKAKRKRNKHKQEKIIETYLDLADVIQKAGGCVDLIKEHREKPLSEFLEDICSTNNIRFKHNKDGN